jgi:hypothetical protein
MERRHAGTHYPKSIVSGLVPRLPGMAAMALRLWSSLSRMDRLVIRTLVMSEEALDIAVKLIWGENDPYLNVGVAEDLVSPSERRLPS